MEPDEPDPDPDCPACGGTGWVDCSYPWCTEQESHGAPCGCSASDPVHD